MHHREWIITIQFHAIGMGKVPFQAANLLWLEGLGERKTTPKDCPWFAYPNPTFSMRRQNIKQTLVNSSFFRPA